MYYELSYQKTMNADEAEKLLECSIGLTLNGSESQYGFEKFRQSSLISFVG